MIGPNSALGTFVYQGYLIITNNTFFDIGEINKTSIKLPFINNNQTRTLKL